MLPLPRFDHHRPRTVDEAMALMARFGERARFIAGGTDMLPNMKHGLVAPQQLVSLRNIEALRGVRREADHIVVGAMTSLDVVANHPEVRRYAAALAQACAAVGGPHHRRMGTLGGNVCLDTRCVYYNQTHFWRQALGYCLKKDGDRCHVVRAGKNCVAAASNDSAPALMALQGSVVLRSATAERSVDMAKFYTADGIDNTVKMPHELLTEVRIPIATGRRSGFEKLRRRGAIDFPLLNVALRLDHGSDGTITAAAIIVSALAARPKRLKAANMLVGHKPAEVLFEQVAQAAHKQCKPLSNIDDDTLWRRAMIKVLVRRGLKRLSGLAPAD